MIRIIDESPAKRERKFQRKRTVTATGYDRTSLEPFSLAREAMHSGAPSYHRPGSFHRKQVARLCSRNHRHRSGSADPRIDRQRLHRHHGDDVLLTEIVILLAIACAGAVAGRAARIPPVVAYLLIGVAAGPGGLGLIEHSYGIERLAEIGVALLLFGVGIELRIDRGRRELIRMLATGAAQVVATIAATTCLLHFTMLPFQAAVVGGFVVALSSTALVFKLYSDRGEIDAPHGRAAASILLFQDLALVPMMLFLPVLASPAEQAWQAGLQALGATTAALLVLVALSRVVLPRALELTARTKTPELFAPVALLAALGMALGATALGLSLPLGAFLAGLALSRTLYAQQVFAELLPLRDAFVALFFSSVGMLFDPGLMLEAPLLPLLLFAAVALKGLLSALIVGIVWKSPRLGLISGLALAQLGEFSFVLSSQAGALGLISSSLQQAILGTAVTTMAATPFLVAAGRRLSLRDLSSSKDSPDLADHVAVIGYGVTGQAVARVLAETSIPFAVLDMDPGRVRSAQSEGMPVRFGDGSKRSVLQAAGLAHCRAVVVAVSDPAATRRIVSVARQMNPHAAILVRAHKVEEIAELERLGATEVIPAEFEASVELFVRLLERLGVPRHVARIQEGIIRAGHYHAMRGTASSFDLLPEIEKLIGAGILERAEVMPGSFACGLNLAQLDLKQRTGALILTMVRNGEPISNPPADMCLQAGDLLVLYGPHAALAQSFELLEPPQE